MSIDGGFTVQSLIDELSKIEDKSTKVVLWADHGQTGMLATTVSEMYIDKNEIGNFMMECLSPFNFVEDKELSKDDYEKVIEIGAP